MRSEIKLFEDQYRFFKDMASKRLLIAFVEFMFEDIEPTNLKWLEKTVFESMRKRMENSKKIHDGKSKGWRSSHWGWRPWNTNWELEWENNRKTTEQTTEKQQENKEEWSMKIEEKENIKRKYLECVYLTDREYNQAVEWYGEKIVKDYIERVNDRVLEKPNSKDRQDRDHYKTMLNRIRRAWINKKPKKQENDSWIYENMRDNDIYLQNLIQWKTT